MGKSLLEQRRTKIVCTIGPATSSEKMLERLIRAGMDCARLNFSHGEPSEHVLVIESIRKISKKNGKEVAILQDLPGPKFRIGAIKNGGMVLKKNSNVVLTTGRARAPGEIPLRAQDLPRYVNKGDFIFLSDGTIKLKILGVSAKEIRCKCEIGGILLSGKGVNIPRLKGGFQSFTPKDRKFLRFGIEHGVDAAAVSFVMKSSDIESVRNFVGRRGSEISIFAKIEKSEAMKNLNQIIEVSDGLMVARGDLGVENPIELVPEMQKEIISRCNLNGIPVITATQMLESMVNNPNPTRAEVTDVANAIFDGTDAVMLSEETAIGKYPLECVRMLSNVALSAEHRMQTLRNIPWKDTMVFKSLEDATCSAVADISASIHARAIIAMFRQLRNLARISRFKPSAPIVSISSRLNVLRRSKLVWGVIPVCYQDRMPEGSILASQARKLFQSGALGARDRIIMVHDGSSEKVGITIRAIELK
ncbi:MAG TPA: pyruvate kinase [Nitrososphaerales archaeon]|nr:pyruvate kinase [Nitrososphaerales archaeon]